MKGLLIDLREHYYTGVAMWLFELLAIILACQSVRRKEKSLLFLIYLVTDFLVFNIDMYLYFFSTIPTRTVNRFVHITNPIISLVELLVYYRFFYLTLTSSRRKKSLLPLAILYALLTVGVISIKINLWGFSFAYISFALGALGFLLLSFPCLLFFYQILHTNSDIDLFRRPSFWIVTGIFFLSFISIPYYLIGNYITMRNIGDMTLLNSLFFNIPLTINFIFLAVAFSCRRTLTI